MNPAWAPPLLKKATQALGSGSAGLPWLVSNPAADALPAALAAITIVAISARVARFSMVSPLP
jgi:hypothetical protein